MGSSIPRGRLSRVSGFLGVPLGVYLLSFVLPSADELVEMLLGSWFIARYEIMGDIYQRDTAGASRLGYQRFER